MRRGPRSDAVPGRLSSGLPFLVGTKTNVLVRNHFSIVVVVAEGDGCFRWNRSFAWISVRQGCMFVVVLGHDFAPFDLEIPARWIKLLDSQILDHLAIDLVDGIGMDIP